MDWQGQRATLQRLRGATSQRCPPHQTELQLRSGGLMQELPSRLPHGLAWGESRLAHSQDGRD